MTKDIHPSTHPPLPPTTEDARVSWLRLLRSRRVGPTTFHRLLAEHGDIQTALDALPEVAARAGVRNYSPCPISRIEAEMEAAQTAGATMICHGDPLYPALLTELPDAPPILWALGNLPVLRRRCLSIVGARNASSLGLRMARSLAKDIGATGHLIVSGLARGIDTAAHKATLKSGTIAVMAGGVDVIYPSENIDLARQIEDTGLRLSEQPMGMSPQARHFPTRNRIISGLSEALIVVEAAAKSGSLITARAALDQGRDVLAVPGHPFDARASGCNMLIRDGATLVRRAEDVLECLRKDPPAPSQAQLDLPEPEKRPRSLQDMNALHQHILNRLGPTPLAEDQLIRDLAQEPAQVTSTLTDLEMEGKILRHPGGLLSRSA